MEKYRDTEPTDFFDSETARAIWREAKEKGVDLNPWVIAVLRDVVTAESQGEPSRYSRRDFCEAVDLANRALGK